MSFRPIDAASGSSSCGPMTPRAGARTPGRPCPQRGSAYHSAGWFVSSAGGPISPTTSRAACAGALARPSLGPVRRARSDRGTLRRGTLALPPTSLRSVRPPRAGSASAGSTSTLTCRGMLRWSRPGWGPASACRPRRRRATGPPRPLSQSRPRRSRCRRAEPSWTTEDFLARLREVTNRRSARSFRSLLQGR